jgi:hypothetical protein
MRRGRLCAAGPWLALSLAASCAGEQPAAREPQTTRPSDAPKPALQARSELGVVDAEAVKRRFHDLGPRFLECERQGIERIEVLSGTAKLFVRIGEDGNAKWAYLEDSDIGDRDTEKCLVSAVMAARWPKPDEGDAEARYDMELPLQATRPPNDWTEDKVAAALSRHRADIDECKAGATRTFRATVYVGHHGRVLSAGVATAARGDDAADCLASLLMKLEGLPSPGSWPAKVTFGL